MHFLKHYLDFFTESSTIRVSYDLQNTHEYSPSLSKTTLNLFPIHCNGPGLYSAIPKEFKLNFSVPFTLLYILFKQSYKLYIA